MTYLVDANILSEPTKPAPDAKVVGWLRKNEAEIVVDPIILGELRFGILLLLGELRFGILLLPRGRRREKLEQWFAAGVERLHCLPWERENGLRWAQLLAKLRASGQAMPIKDSLIAAAALVHDLIVVTRNRNDFRKSGVQVINSFASGLISFQKQMGPTRPRCLTV